MIKWWINREGGGTKKMASLSPHWFAEGVRPCRNVSFFDAKQSFCTQKADVTSPPVIKRTHCSGDHPYSLCVGAFSLKCVCVCVCASGKTHFLHLSLFIAYERITLTLCRLSLRWVCHFALETPVVNRHPPPKNATKQYDCVQLQAHCLKSEKIGGCGKCLQKVIDPQGAHWGVLSLCASWLSCRCGAGVCVCQVGLCSGAARVCT